MERYTYFDGGKWRLKIGDTEYSGGVVDRLAAYEDTGLEPEDFKQAFHEDAVLKLAGQALGIAPARLRELAQADREGRVRIIAGPRPREAVCGNCGNFIRNPGTRTGVCRVQSFYRDRHGKEEPRRGIFSPSQSRKACRKFVRAEAALRREQDG